MVSNDGGKLDDFNGLPEEPLGSSADVPSAPAPHNAASPSPLPSINAKGQNLDLITSQVWKALLKANDPAQFFRHGGRLSRIEHDDCGRPIITELTCDRLRHEAAKFVRWFKLKKTLKEKWVEIAAKPPNDVIRNVLATPDPPLPVLTRIVAAPVFAPDGTLRMEPGYNAQARVYHAPSDGLQITAIPDKPSEEDVAWAKKTILVDLLGDFPFVGERDPEKENPERAHAVALLLQPFVRELIDGSTPLYLIEKPTPGTGASLLAEVLSYPALGQPVSTLAPPKDEEEWRKRITSTLRRGPSIVLIDNLKDRLDSQALSIALTSPVWEDRILGLSENVVLPIRCAWIATGNNPSLSDEIQRRTIRIRLDAKMDHPEDRPPEKFRHEDLRAWVAKQRASLVRSALILTRAWLSAGCPVPENLPKLGGFVSWSKVVGGILGHAGILGFLRNRKEFIDTSDNVGLQVRAFIDLWWKTHGGKVVAVKALWELLAANEGVLDLGEGNQHSLKSRLGKKLGSIRDRQFGKIRVVAAGSAHHAQQWQLVQVAGEEGDKTSASSGSPHAVTDGNTSGKAVATGGNGVADGGTPAGSGKGEDVKIKP